MTTLLRDVVTSGTATRALELRRKDLAGKTGTTNENVDAWFCGFNAGMVGIAWIGYDQPRTLGNNETGGVAALPIWISYMQRALKGVPEQTMERRRASCRCGSTPTPGLRDDSSRVSDWFLAEFAPRMAQDALAPAAMPGATPARDVRDQLF